MRGPFCLNNRGLRCAWTFVLIVLAGGAQGTEAVHAFIMGLPKTELHVHLEGTIEPEDYLALVDRNGLDSAYATPEAVRERLTYQRDLDTFIEVYEELLSALTTARDFEEAVVRYAARVAPQGVVYVEMFFDPQMHTSRGIALEDVMAGLKAGSARAAAEQGVEIAYIACFNRDRSAESAHAHLEKLVEYQDVILGIGLDNPEVIDFPEKFQTVFARAGELGFRLTTHLDVNVPNTLTHHRDAIELLGVERIDHGLNVIDDTALVDTVVGRGIGLTGCATLMYRHEPGAPETKARLTERFGRVRRLLDAGVEISLNSDDPGMMRGLYLGDLYLLGYEGGYLTLGELAALARHGFHTAWLAPAERAEYLQRLDTFVASHPAMVAAHGGD